MALFTTVLSADFDTISGVDPDATARWKSSGGQTTLRFFPAMMETFGLTVSGSEGVSSMTWPGKHHFDVSPLVNLEVWAPEAAFDGFIGGELLNIGELDIKYPGGRVSLDGFAFRPSSANTLDIVAESGEVLFHLDHIHTFLHSESESFEMSNMDLRLSAGFAARLGQPQAEGIVIGQAFTETALDIPPGAQTRGACTNPNWHDGVTYFNDVALLRIGSVQQVAREAGVRVAIAPSATLGNVGSADVQWEQKFTTPEGGTYPPPYGRDQHPFLVWAVYRESGGSFEQIGISEVKHAFFTTNVVCSCGGGHILWSGDNPTNSSRLGCQDTYGLGNNNNQPDLGLRDEVPSFTGAWEQCGSMFAPDASAPGPCTQTFDGQSADPYERKLVVAESELETADANYWLDAWYVVRDDINIFNGMARVSVTPVFNGDFWQFSPSGTTPGPAIDEWVPPGTQNASSAHVRVNDSEGHFSVAVKTTNLGGGVYRYVYALMNYDYDPQFNSFSLDLPANVSVNNITYSDADEDPANDWVGVAGASELTWTAPADTGLKWGHMATLSFEVDSAPDPGEVTLTAKDSPAVLPVDILVLADADRVFEQGFEGVPPL